MSEDPGPAEAEGGAGAPGVVEVAVGAVVTRRSGEAGATGVDELLLVRRGRGTAVGEWSLPGGRVNFGEGLEAAVTREVKEETDLDVSVGRFLGWVERMGAGPGAYHYVILDFEATPRDPAAPLRAGDDAAAAAWVGVDRLGDLRLVAGLADFLARTGAIPSGAVPAGIDRRHGGA